MKVNYKDFDIYVDMDGVLANFDHEKDAVNRFKTEKGFFKRLKPIKSNVKAFNELVKNNYNIYILTASPNEQADKDKIKWCEKHLNINKNRIITMRIGQNKADFVMRPNQPYNLLIDDYNKNCFDFVNRGYEAKQIRPYKTIKRLLNIE